MESKIKSSTNLTLKSIFNRLNGVVAILLAAIIFTSATLVSASNPTNGSVAPTVGSSVSWNGTAPGGSSPEGEATCLQGTTCDAFTLNVSGAPADWAGKLIKVKIAWNLPASDYDFYIHKDSLTGPETDRSGEAPPVVQEFAEIDPSVTGTGVYVVNVVYYAASGTADQFRGSATVENKPVSGSEVPPTQSTATPPTYDNFVPPSTLGQRAGEPTVGLNFATGNAMFIASLQTLRVTFDDTVTPATATWVNKSAPNTSVTSFDPILFTDSQTNRTFVSQLLPSKVSLMAFTDNDGESWTPSQGSGINSGVDHQTVGGGPYAKNADGSLKGGAVRRPGADARIYPNAVYYASQDIGVAEIARSDDGGLTFGVAVPMYDITQCGGLHGHIKVAPDGTVYVPNKSCGGQQAVAVSEDNGLTWQVRKVPGSTSGRTDPSVGIGSDGTIYFGYANGDGTARIAMSRDRGKTWENDQNVGFFAGIKNTVFPAVTAGDGDRAAYFFLGSTTGGSAGTGTDQTSPYFNGVWYGYIATTYDRGRTWVTVNATGNDPIQRGVVCTNGTTCPTGTRNLLDFNDLEVDNKGRAVAAVADGCITAECIAGVDKNNDGQLNTRFDNDGGRRALIIRQSGGLSLFKANDPQTPPTGGGGNGATIEDNDPRVEYSNGWHMMNDAKASDGHFRMNNGQSPNFYAKVSFKTTGQNGSITYHFARSPKGGTVDVFVDGIRRDTINFYGPNGTKQSPEFGHNVKYGNLSEGDHVLELRSYNAGTNNNGTVYVDKFTVENGTSNATPASGPGATQSNTTAVGLGQDVVNSITLDSRATDIAVMAEAANGAPIRLILIDPSGSILQTVEATNGTAVIEKPVTQVGTFKVKVVNLSLGPIQVFTATTPLVTR